jgi:mannose-6-phosphate isomerase-like protein (cupin superfamily)
MKRTQYKDIDAYTTKDGSLVRELMHPDNHGNQKQSLAEAIVPPGVKTMRHLHMNTEEIYHITSGCGLMTLDQANFEVNIGDTISIMPCTPHCIENTGDEDLVILCTCTPAYSHDDTQLLD